MMLKFDIRLKLKHYGWIYQFIRFFACHILYLTFLQQDYIFLPSKSSLLFHIQFDSKENEACLPNIETTGYTTYSDRSRMPIYTLFIYAYISVEYMTSLYTTLQIVILITVRHWNGARFQASRPPISTNTIPENKKTW